MNLRNYFSELKRRNVFKSAIAYLIVAWLIVQVLSIILPTFEAPTYVLKLSIVILAIGFPFWLIFSWIYDLTKDGIIKTSTIEYDASISKLQSNRLNAIIIRSLSITVIILLITNFSTHKINQEKIAKTESKVDNRNSIAILPFTDLSLDKDNSFFSEGMHEDVLNKLAGVKNLRVIARTSVMRYNGFQGSLDS